MTLTNSQPSQDLVHLSTPEGGIAHINMRDEASDNGLSPAFVGALLGAFEAARNPKFKVVILSGLDHVFCSGATPAVLRDLKTQRIAPTELSLGRYLIDYDLPVIAAAAGPAVGGGLALALSADLVVLGQQSRYGANFMTLGITPGMGMTQLLETALSPCRAHEMLYTGAFIRGRAFEGGVNAVRPKAEVWDHALGLAQRMVDAPRENLVLLKKALTLPRRKALETAMTLEPLMHHISLQHLTPDALGQDSE